MSREGSRADALRFRHTITAVRLPPQYVVDAEKHLVIVKFGRKVTARDIARYASMLKANSEFQPEFSEIVDLTDVEELDLQAEDFLRLADEIDPLATEAKRAFVVRTSVQDHAAHMHKLLRTKRNIEIFRSVEEAASWIGT